MAYFLLPFIRVRVNFQYEKIDQNWAKNFVHGYQIEKHGIFVQAKTLHFEKLSQFILC